MAKRTWGIVVVAVMLVAVGHAAVGAQEWTPVDTRLRVVSGSDRAMVSRAISKAIVMLESEDCQRVLTDFTDPEGRTLREKLDSLERAPGQFLTELWFIDASRERSCMRQEIAAYTTPGTRVIYVCATKFGQPREALNGPFGAATVIHEMLHALGLHENGPHPTPEQITRRVLQRCNR